MNPEIRTLVERATAQMVARRNQPVVFELNVATAVSLVSQLQLALRHPANVGPTGASVKQLVLDLIDSLDPQKGEVYQLLMMGFDARYDQLATAETPAENLDWDKAVTHFREIRSQYQRIADEPGVNSTLALQLVFQPLAKRYYDGERTHELYQEMLAVE